MRKLSILMISLTHANITQCNFVRASPSLVLHDLRQTRHSGVKPRHVEAYGNAGRRGLLWSSRAGASRSILHWTHSNTESPSPNRLDGFRRRCAMACKLDQISPCQSPADGLCQRCVLSRGLTIVLVHHSTSLREQIAEQV
jgi:hypothetical protein